MASWKKVIVSGSDAELNSLSVGTITNSSTVAATQLTGSFTGSFYGDGSQLTGLPSAPISSYTNAGNDRLVTSVNATTVNAESNLTFDGSRLTVTGNLTVGQVTGSGLQFTGARPTGTDNSVLVLSSGNKVVTDEIDSRVWGTTLVDNAGGNSSSTRLAIWSDSDSLQGNANLTFTSDTLTVNGSTFGQDVVIAGDLTINGDMFSQNITNVAIEDKFILLNSGSATGDGGIVIQTEAGFTGVVLGWDDSANRFAAQVNTKLAHTATAIAPDAYLTMVIDVDGGLTENAAHQVNGNIKIDGGEIYIYS